MKQPASRIHTRIHIALMFMVVITMSDIYFVKCPEINMCMCVQCVQYCVCSVHFKCDLEYVCNGCVAFELLYIYNTMSELAFVGVLIERKSNCVYFFLSFFLCLLARLVLDSYESIMCIKCHLNLQFYFDAIEIHFRVIRLA